MIMTTDQGNPYGQRGLWGHPQWTDPPFMHDVTFNVPLVVRRPGSVRTNRIVDDLVSHYDLFATILDHVGIADVAVDGSPGRSFASALRGEPIADGHDAVFFEAETARSIRTTEYLYTAHLDGTGESELYDLVADPEQWTNVSSEPSRTDTRDGLHDRLSAFFADYVDPRYDLWNGGTGQAMVSRYLYFKHRYGRDWDVTMEVGPTREA